MVLLTEITSFLLCAFGIIEFALGIGADLGINVLQSVSNSLTGTTVSLLSPFAAIISNGRLIIQGFLLLGAGEVLHFLLEIYLKQSTQVIGKLP